MKLARPTFILHTLLISLIMSGLFACGGPWRDGYFKKGVDHLTQDEVSEKMGPPHTAKTPALGGGHDLDLSGALQRQRPGFDGFVGHHQCGERGGKLDRQAVPGCPEADPLLLPLYPDV